MPLSDPNWWPTPPQRPPESLSNQLLNGWLAPVLVAVVVVVLALALGRHQTAAPHAAPAGTAARPLTGPGAEAARRDAEEQAFRDCMSKAGIGGGAFGRPSPDKVRQALTLCRAVLQGGAHTVPLGPQPATTTAAAPPIA